MFLLEEVNLLKLHFLEQLTIHLLILFFQFIKYGTSNFTCTENYRFSFQKEYVLDKKKRNRCTSIILRGNLPKKQSLPSKTPFPISKCISPHRNLALHVDRAKNGTQKSGVHRTIAKKASISLGFSSP